jgi:putative SOS response-associated peptidase YedK
MLNKKNVFFVFLSLVSLCLCLVAPFIYFLGIVKEGSYKWIFFLASLSWFVFATLWSRKRKKTNKPWKITNRLIQSPISAKE